MQLHLLKAQLGAVADVILGDQITRRYKHVQEYAGDVLRFANEDAGLEGIQVILKRWGSASLAAMSIGLRHHSPAAAYFVALLMALRNRNGLRVEQAAPFIAKARAFSEGREATAGKDEPAAYEDLERAFLARLDGSSRLTPGPGLTPRVDG